MKIGSYTVRQEHLVAVAALALFFLGLILFGPGPEGLGSDPMGVQQGSSHFTTRTGGKALYTLLRRLDIPVSRHARKIEDLPDRAALLMLLAQPRPFTDEELSWLKGWVEKGGTVLWCPRQGLAMGGPSRILETFGLDLSLEGTEVPGDVIVTSKPLLARSLEEYRLSLVGRSRLSAKGESGAAKPLAEDESGWIAAMVPVSEGRFIALADAALVGNATLEEGDNAEFIVHLVLLGAKGGRVVFDEFHHGFQEGNSAFALLWDSPAGMGALLVMAAVFCGVFTRGRRLGPPLDLHEERRRKPTEYMDACARLCKGLKAGPQSLSMILTEFRSFLKQRFGAATPEAMARLDRRAGLPLETVARTLEQARRLATTHTVDEKALVACCRRLEKIRSAVAKNDGTGPG